MIKWKQDLKLKASLQFERNKKVNWNKLIYENQSNQNVPTSDFDEGRGQNNASIKKDDDGDESFFKIKRPVAEQNPLNFDNAKYLTNYHTWVLAEKKPQRIDEAFDSIRDCFVTGKWDKKTDARYLLSKDDEKNNSDDSDVWDAFDEPYGDTDEEIYGDFEDVETGKVFKAADGSKNGKKRAAEDDLDESESESEEDEENDGTEKKKTSENDEGKIRKKPKSEMTKRERLMEKKKRLKEQFDKG